MKNLKGYGRKLMSVLLTLCMVLSMGTTVAFATDGGSGESVPGEAGNAQIDGIGEGELSNEAEITVSESGLNDASDPGTKTDDQSVDGIAINETNFPDDNFRAVVSGVNYDKDQNGVLSAAEIASITAVYCPGEGIESLQGIEFFTAMKSLDCFENNLTTLDVSHNTALEELRCWENGMTSLNVSGNTALKKLECYKNNLTSLNVSGNTALEFLSCYENSLTSLDVSHNTALVTLYCSVNSLTDLNVSGNTALVTLNCFFNSLTDLNVSGNAALVELNCGANNLTTLNISNNTALEHLYCFGNNLTTLDVSNNTALKGLSGWENCLTSFDVSGLPDLGFDVGDCTYSITVGEDRTFDLSTLPGSFDVSRASNWTGGTVSGTVLTVAEGVDEVTYDYYTGLTIDDTPIKVTFTLTLPASEPETTPIDRIDVTGVTPPFVGAMPTIAGLSLGEGVDIDTLDTFWDMKQGDSYSDMVGGTAVDNLPFKAGERYGLNINAYLKDGYTFAEGIKVYYNGIEIPVYSEELDIDASCYEIDGDYLWVWIGFDALTEDGHTHEYGAWTPDDETTHSKECACTDKITEAHKFTWVIDKEATATEAGSKHEECSDCGYKKAAVEIPASGGETAPDYQIIEGANGSWTQNSDGTLTFRANGDFSKFTGVKVDGALIDESNYTAVSGSTVVTLKTDYLKTLSVGTHTLTVVYNDGECSTNFVIKAAQSTGGDNDPARPDGGGKPQNTGTKILRTGDDSNLALWIALLAVSVFGMAGTAVYSRRKRAR